MAGATEVAARLVEALIAGDFDAVARDFDDAMRAGLPVGQIRTVWGQVESEVGTPIAPAATETHAESGYTTWLITCEGPRARFVVRVAVDAAGKVGGLHISPEATAHPPPPYADGSAFTERPLRVGAGEWALPGTLTLPRAKGVFKRARRAPAVVCVHGSGPNDRDETVGGSKVFLDLALGLATKGIAVLRHEKRTRIHGARIDPDTVTVREEAIEDALAAAEGLRSIPEVDPEAVFVLGHSLGGSLAPAIGAEDPRLAGLVVVAGATRPAEDLILEQSTYLASVRGRPTEAELATLRKQVARVKKLSPASKARARDLPLGGGGVAYWLSLRAHDPAEWTARAKQPFLVLQGERDYQVTLADFEGWKRLLEGRDDATFRSYPRLNHLFAEGEGPSTPEEYARPANVAREVVEDVASWISSLH